MGFFSNVGSFLNDITGVTSSSNSAFSQQVQLNNMSYKQQKEFAQNAHQWEMEDLKKAGLNPALTAGGTSAGAVAGGGATSGSGSVGTSAMSPLGILDGINNTKATNAQTELAGAQSRLNNAESMKIIEMLPLDKKEKQALIDKLFAEKKNINEDTKYKGYFPTTIGQGHSFMGFGGNTNTTVYTKGGKIGKNK